MSGERRPNPPRHGSSFRTSDSARRMNGASSASARRVNFDDKAAAFGSGRRANQQSFIALSESQQSATESAVSMNHLFSEARREIRRGRDHKPDEVVVSSPLKDVESGQVVEAVLDWRSDIDTIKNMLNENRVLSLMLICIPFGFGTYLTGIGGDSAVFVLNFISIIPLAWLLGEATEELALRSNQTVGGLLNATFGKALQNEDANAATTAVTATVALSAGPF